MSRLLLIPGVAVSALFALYLKKCATLARHPLFWLHGPFAAFLCLLGCLGLYAFKMSFDLPASSMPKQLNSRQHVIYLSGVSLPAGLSMLKQLHTSGITPASIQVLSHATQDQRIERIDARSIRITSPHGWLHLPVEQMFRSRGMPFEKGSQIRMPRFLVTIEALTQDLRPKSVRFEFNETLEHPDYRWMCFKPMSLTECKLPKVGASMRLEGMVSW
jgi:hypothetical protein